MTLSKFFIKKSSADVNERSYLKPTSLPNTTKMEEGIWKSPFAVMNELFPPYAAYALISKTGARVYEIVSTTGYAANIFHSGAAENTS